MTLKKKKLSPSIEDYLESIYMLDSDGEGLRSIDVATHLEVSKPSVNKALRYLVESGLAVQEKYSLIYLTEIGKEKAKEVAFRHETIKEFLIKILRVEPEQAEVEACNIEHFLSTETVEKIRTLTEERL